MKNLAVILWLFLMILSPSVLFAGGRIVIEDGPGGYLAVPEMHSDEENRPLVILMHDWWGLNLHLLETADRLKDEGFVVFALDLYENRVAKDVVEAHRYQQQIDPVRVHADLVKVLVYFRDYPGVDQKRLGMIGWSHGAKLALGFVLEKPRAFHALGFFDAPIKEDKRLELVRAPVIAFWGAKDRAISSEEIEDFEFRLKQGRRRVSIHRYPERGHGFSSPYNPHYHPQDAEDAWMKLIEFFKVNLV